MKIEQIKIENLKPYEKNSRVHTDEQIEQIKQSITEFGFTNPILVDKNNEVIAGHGRLVSAKLLKMQNVPCIRLGHLTEMQKKAYVIADNKLALNATWNIEMLNTELVALIDNNYEVSLTGFDDAEIDTLLAPLEPAMPVFETVTTDQETKNKCPKCQYEW